MVEAESIESLRSALAPVEALRGEQTQLETSMHESLASLEALHGELAEWQRDLAQRQADLDAQTAAAAQVAAERPRLDDALARMRDELQQLEDENAEQLQAIDDLDRQLAASQAELRLLRKQNEELAAALETERERGVDEHRLWATELREMRRLLERQSEALALVTGPQPADDAVDDGRAAPGPRVMANDESDAEDPSSRAAELRRRASTRRAAHRRLA